MTIAKLTPALLHLALVHILPWLPGRSHGGGVPHPLVSLILLVLIVALVYWTFRRRTS
jgi:hypothetical protein